MSRDVSGHIINFPIWFGTFTCVETIHVRFVVSQNDAVNIERFFFFQNCSVLRNLLAANPFTLQWSSSDLSSPAHLNILGPEQQPIPPNGLFLFFTSALKNFTSRVLLLSALLHAARPFAFNWSCNDLSHPHLSPSCMGCWYSTFDQAGRTWTAQKRFSSVLGIRGVVCYKFLRWLWWKLCRLWQIWNQHLPLLTAA